MIRSELSGGANGFRRFHYSQVSSTNTVALELAKEGHDCLWVSADEQSQGRGSRGRDWTSQSGNLFASVVLQSPSALNKMHELTFVASLAVGQTIAQVSNNRLSPELKWPNDVLVEGRKCAGILLEASSNQDGHFVVVGIGINCASHPDGTTHPACDLLQLGIEASREEVFHALAANFALLLERWQQGQAFSTIREQWLAKAYGIGETAQVKIPNRGEVTGVFASVDQNGYMMLEQEDGQVQSISAGDLFFPNQN